MYCSEQFTLPSHAQLFFQHLIKQQFSQPTASTVYSPITCAAHTTAKTTAVSEPKDYSEENIIKIIEYI